jgi:hypothetical protein
MTYMDTDFKRALVQSDKKVVHHINVPSELVNRSIVPLLFPDHDAFGPGNLTGLAGTN